MTEVHQYIGQISARQWQKKYQNISNIWWEYRRSDGTEVALNQQANIYFSMERGKTIMN
jgi:hypothetical protein